MKDTSIKMAEQKKDWALTHNALYQLLLWLDEGADSGGARYLEMRRRLVAYFDRKNCQVPDELADETLNRVARRLTEAGSITSDSPAHYCYIVARFVFLESLRQHEREQSLDEAPTRHALAQPRADRPDIEAEKQAECLERCVQNLEPDQRKLIIRYYTGEQRVKIDNRHAMAAKFGITMNALSIRAFRLREKLEACIRNCASQSE